MRKSGQSEATEVPSSSRQKGMGMGRGDRLPSRLGGLDWKLHKLPQRGSHLLKVH